MALGGFLVTADIGDDALERVLEVMRSYSPEPVPAFLDQWRRLAAGRDAPPTGMAGMRGASQASTS
ncbi:MAG: hypothetical protein ACOY4L_04145 [Pseudomonadota bacterium]